MTKIQNFPIIHLLFWFYLRQGDKPVQILYDKRYLFKVRKHNRKNIQNECDKNKQLCCDLCVRHLDVWHYSYHAFVYFSSYLP